MKQDIRKEITQEITKKVQAKLYDEVAEMVTRQFQQQFEHYGMRRSGKGSCLDVGAQGDDMDVTRPCHLYIFSPTWTMLVARSTVYEAAIVVHSVELGEDEVKVLVDEVVVSSNIKW
ncbi:hypothetical protein LR48_Vigan11g106000 [Vigna angularis]|uniref:DUF8039 domain-containing protein n=1 Tax=Phaseolus angularis TaxID=3914 RepID=A0A0L9VT54_PHAAN|nr:hypothetical protein LR48_Vigan11g106000 [Vigna angularis]